MVRYFNDDGIFEASVEKVWRLIEAHSESNVAHIHPSFLTAKATPEGHAMHLRATVRGPDGKPGPFSIRVHAHPPHTQLVEFTDGPFAGSWMVTSYVPVSPTSTRVVTSGEFRIPGLDDATTFKIVDDFMEKGFAEDSAYLRKMA